MIYAIAAVVLAALTFYFWHIADLAEGSDRNVFVAVHSAIAAICGGAAVLSIIIFVIAAIVYTPLFPNMNHQAGHPTSQPAEGAEHEPRKDSK